MVVVFTFVFGRTSGVMPGERFIGVIALVESVVDGGAGGARRVVERRLYGALGAHALAVGVLQRAPAAVRVPQALRTLLERAARRRTLVLVRLRQHQPAHAARTYDRLIRRRYTRPQV